jgi:hypothetical protein
LTLPAFGCFVCLFVCLFICFSPFVLACLLYLLIYPTNLLPVAMLYALFVGVLFHSTHAPSHFSSAPSLPHPRRHHTHTWRSGLPIRFYLFSLIIRTFRFDKVGPTYPPSLPPSLPLPEHYMAKGTFKSMGWAVESWGT